MFQDTVREMRDVNKRNEGHRVDLYTVLGVLHSVIV